MDENSMAGLMEGSPWTHSREPEPLVEGKGFRLLEAAYTAKEEVLQADFPARAHDKEMVFTSTFTRMFYGFSDFLTFMIEEQICDDAEGLVAEYMDCIQCVLGSIEPMVGCTFRIIYWLESNDSIRMEFNMEEVREYLKITDPEKIQKLEFCKELLEFRSRISCGMVMDQVLNALDAEADDAEYYGEEY